jgi:hypothetical protein
VARTATIRRREGASTAPARDSVRLLVAVTVALALLRLVALGRWGLWIDEGHTLHDADNLRLTSLTDFPLGLAVTSFVLRLLEGPHDEAVLRAVPAALGILGILATAWCFEPAIGRRRAWIAALLLGLSSWHVFWSQSLRAYTLAQTLSLAGGGLALRGCFRGSRAVFFGGIAIAAFAALAHPSAALLVPFLYVGPWLVARTGRALPWTPSTRVLVLTAIACAVAASPWAWSVWSTYHEKKAGPSFVHFALSCGFYFTPPVLVAGAVAAWRTLRSDSPGDAWILVVAAGTLLTAAAAASAVKVSAYYVFVTLPWVAALASKVVLIEPAPSRAWERWVAKLGTAAVLAWSAADLALYYTVRHGDRPRWKEAYALVTRRRGPDDLVFGMAAPIAEYYLSPGREDVRRQVRMVPLTHYSESSRTREAWIRRERRMWFVLNREELRDWPTQERERFEQFLEDQCHLEARFEVRMTPRNHDVEVYLRP